MRSQVIPRVLEMETSTAFRRLSDTINVYSMLHTAIINAKLISIELRGVYSTRCSSSLPYFIGLDMCSNNVNSIIFNAISARAY